MSRAGYMLLGLAVGTQAICIWSGGTRVSASGAPTPAPENIPTVAVFKATPVAVPTVAIPRPTATPTPRPKRVRRHPAHARPRPTPTPTPAGTWVLAYLTSYCPGTAGWLSASGMTVFYGMLANNYYRFGTRVYLPVIGITGVVEDRLTAFPVWNHFDVWSPVCYGTPTGWFRVQVQG